MKKLFYLLCFLHLQTFVFAQTNLFITNPIVDKVLKGQYNPDDFKQGTVIKDKQSIVNGLFNKVSNDSFMSYLVQLSSFYNRNTSSDTVSEFTGIGAARRWAYHKFQTFSQLQQNRLQVSYFQFDQVIGGMPQHRNILAVLPGSDTSDKSLVIVEAHIDSRCEGVNDTSCIANGMEDNGSGTGLVLELARVMSAYTFKRSIVFMLLIGEEQGLNGSTAFALYCKNNSIPIRAVQNNDIVGGIICGKTASPPGCPGENNIDSINVRIFSAGTNLSAPKSLARFLKLEYQEELMPLLPVKPIINIMNAEDRTGRGGDHIPFRQQGYSSVRMTSANEHGDANPIPTYTDRQHSVRDILGKDINHDGVIDSFYVDMDYLKRNTLINGNSIAMAANGPDMADIDLINDGNGLTVKVNKAKQYDHYRIGFRTHSNDFDTLINIDHSLELKTYHVRKDSIYYVSIASVDAEGIESIFSTEKFVKVLGVPAAGIKTDPANEKAIQLFAAYPNPADETTTISVIVNRPVDHKEAYILLTDINGKETGRLKMELRQHINEVIYEHGFHAKGIIFCSLIIDGRIFDTGKLVFR